MRVFSSKELISFVFANENDIYYSEDLRKRNLNQYLWETLHENYETVYFLSAEDNRFRVRTFGDLSGDIAGLEKQAKPKLWSFLGSSEQEKFSSWLLRQLCAKPGKAAAFVCPIEDFCAVLSRDCWEDTLRDIAQEKRRSGIFVLTASATAEHTKDLLLNSPVFDRLGETAVTDVREGGLREIYSAIQKSKRDSCLFLNTFTRERIRNLLLRLSVEYPQRNISCRELDILSGYLMLYLHDLKKQQAEPFLEHLPPIGYLHYQELYDQLAKESVWARFMQHSAGYVQSVQDQIFPDLSDSFDIQAPVLRDPKCYAGKCMMLKLPKWVCDQDCEGSRPEKLLEKIRKEVSRPKNKPENEEIIAAIEDFLNQLDSVTEGNLDAYILLLLAVEFCVSKVYTAPDAEEMERIRALIARIHSGAMLTWQCFQTQQHLSSYRTLNSAGPLYQKTISQLQDRAAILEAQRKQYTDLISASILQFAIPTVTTDIMKRLDELTREAEQMETAEQATPAPAAEPEPTPAAEPEPEEDTPAFDDEFFFRPEDYTYIPPTQAN